MDIEKALEELEKEIDYYEKCCYNSNIKAGILHGLHKAKEILLKNIKDVKTT